MANQAVGDFFNLLDGDKDLREELQAEIEAATATAMIEVAGRRGLEFSREDLESQLTNQVAELSEEELEAVAGGVSMRSRIGNRPSILTVATAGSQLGFDKVQRITKTTK